MTRRNTTMHRLLAGMAEAAMPVLNVAPQNRAAMRDTLISVFEHQVVRIIGQDEVRLRGWRVAPSERQARQQRVAAMLRAGMAAEEVARREGLHPGYVRKLRARILSP